MTDNLKMDLLYLYKGFFLKDKMQLVSSKRMFSRQVNQYNIRQFTTNHGFKVVIIIVIMIIQLIEYIML